MKIVKFIPLFIVLMALLPASALAGDAWGPHSRYVRAVHKGYCPVGLICPSSDRNVQPSVSTPSHPTKMPPNAGPPYYVAKSGDTLWWIAKYYIGDGASWRELCWFPDGAKTNARARSPRLLQVGDTVGFC